MTDQPGRQWAWWGVSVGSKRDTDHLRRAGRARQYEWYVQYCYTVDRRGGW